jgi:hypothetical protein
MAEATRKYHGVTYHTLMTKHICKGVQKVAIHGGQAEGSLIRVDETATEVHVEVILG